MSIKAILCAADDIPGAGCMVDITKKREAENVALSMALAVFERPQNLFVCERRMVDGAEKMRGTVEPQCAVIRCHGCPRWLVHHRRTALALLEMPEKVLALKRRMVDGADKLRGAVHLEFEIVGAVIRCHVCLG